MNKVKDRTGNHKDRKDKRSEAKPEQPKPVAGEQRPQDPWPPSGGPGERSDKDAIGRPVQLDND